MTNRKMRYTAGLAVAVTISVGLFGAPAAADDGTGAAPAAIVDWFSHDAPQVAGEVLSTDAVGLGATEPADSYTADAPVRLHSWNEDFVAGDSSEIVVADDQWVAALHHNGDVVGTIAATLSPAGQVTMSYIDDDVAAGTALTSGDVAGMVVQDPRMGGLVEVLPDGAAEGLSAVAATEVDSVDQATELREAVLDAHDPGTWDTSVDGAGAVGETHRGGQLGVGLAVVLAGLLLWFVGRRTPKRQRH